MSTVESEVIKGRWGYYAITYEQFLKLKELCKRVRKYRASLSAVERWQRKAPQNRVYRPVLRNAQNQPIGRAWPGTPILCPDIAYPALADRVMANVSSTQSGNIWWVREVLYYYHLLRHPAEIPEDVPLAPSWLLSQLDQVLEETGGFVRPS